MKKKIKIVLAALSIVSFMTPMAYAAGKATVNVSAKSISSKKIELTFKTQPAEGLVINHEGPWKLEIKDAGTIKPDKTEWKRSDWREDIGGFMVTANPGSQKSAEIKYKLVAFICTKDKSQCFREVIDTNAKITW
jgi:hypothetical protein